MNVILLVDDVNSDDLQVGVVDESPQFELIFEIVRAFKTAGSECYTYLSLSDVFVNETLVMCITNNPLAAWLDTEQWGDAIKEMLSRCSPDIQERFKTH